MRGLKCLFPHVLLLTVLGISIGQAADQTTDKTGEFSLFADLQQQITDLKIQMSKIIKDKTKCEAEIQSVDKAEILNLRTEMKSLAIKISAIESVFNPNIWMIQPSTEPPGTPEQKNDSGEKRPSKLAGFLRSSGLTGELELKGDSGAPRPKGKMGATGETGERGGAGIQVEIATDQLANINQTLERLANLGQGLIDTDLSEIKNTLGSLQGKFDTLDSQVSAIDSKAFLGKSCDTLKLRERSQKKRTIYPNGRDEPGVDVLCDFETGGKAWTVIQKRSLVFQEDLKEEFYRNWIEYENGFGSLDGNFWIGLKTIHALTKNRDQELRIDLWDFQGDHAFAKYSNFSISDSSDFYRLTIGGYTGTAGDSLHWNNGSRFSTKDKDNDDHQSIHCAEAERGAWWYKNCGASNLNGFYNLIEEAPEPSRYKMYWYYWKDSWRPLQQVEMKIRRRR